MAEQSPYADGAVPATVFYDDQKGTGSDVVAVTVEAQAAPEENDNGS